MDPTIKNIIEDMNNYGVHLPEHSVLNSLIESDSESESENSLYIDENCTQDSNLFDCISVNKPNVVSYLGCKVINLSNVSLTNDQIKVLEKGITFVPTPDKIDLGEINYDVHRFLRRLRLKVHFDGMSNEFTQGSQNLTQFNQIPKPLVKFRPYSNWLPPNSDNTVSAFCENVKRDLAKLKPQLPDRSNLTRKESRALSDIKKIPDIIIKKADKGSSIVVMNKNDYIQEGMRQLSDQNYYVEVPNDLSGKHHKEIQSLIAKYESNGDISKDIAKCLKNKEPKTASFYLLPKIHKVKEAGVFPPGRPIISANGCPTERISAFVDENIKGAVPKIKSYIKDTTDFIHKIENLIIPENAILVTFDVVSLYTNIPNNEGIMSVAKSLQKHPPPFTCHRIVLELLKQVLFKNNFEFNGKHFLQVGGTAMGTKLAPSYANIFMGDLEEKILSKCDKKPFFWVRYIDDIFAVWTEGHESLSEFHNFINTQHHSIKFTMEKSTEKVIFLDTWVKTGKNKNLEVELYSKPTDTHNYLHFSSYHQSHTKRAGPFGQFLRVRRNCTNTSDYEKHSEKMKQHYVDRGYPAKHVEAARKTALNRNRKDLLDPGRIKPNKNDNVLPLVLTQHPSNSQVHKIIMDNWDILKFSEKCRIALPEKPLFTRRGKNLKDMLIQSKLKAPKDYSCLDKPTCKKENCTVCRNVKIEEITSSVSLHTYMTPSNCTCQTINVVYCLTCSICQKQYVGETKRPFMVRYKEHMKDIQYNRKKPIVEHVLTHMENEATLIPQILEMVKRNPNLEATTVYRRQRENHWIVSLRTMAPEGLNTKE